MLGRTDVITDILCGLARAPQALSPVRRYEGLDLRDSFENAVVKRHADVGSPLAARSQDEIMQGFHGHRDNHIHVRPWWLAIRLSPCPQISLTRTR